MSQKTLTQKILEAHSALGAWAPDKDIALRIDQVLLQDATGTQACMQLEQLIKNPRGTLPRVPRDLSQETVVIDSASATDGTVPLLQFEQFGLDEVQVPLAIQYVDHNIKQIDERNADDHAFLLSFAKRYGIFYSPLGNGICHQVHVERFAVPGATILGADSHTTTSGALAAFALGVGGLDVAAALAGYPFWMRTPKVVEVQLTGALKPWVSAKDIVLELLRRFGVKWGIDVAGIGGVMVLEFAGPAIKSLGVPQRATIANMAAELNATAVFPSDERTREFMALQRREWSFKELGQDSGANYDVRVELDLASLEPLIALPSSPDNVVPVREVEGTPVAQVCVGSSVNSWYEDLALVAAVLRGCRVPFVRTQEGQRLLQLLVSPGSAQILNVMERKGFIKDLRMAGAVLLESACGPCVGMGGAPPSGANSLRTMNRNFPGRSGTKDDRVYLASSETAAATAKFGVITDPRTLGAYPNIGTYDLEDSDFTDELIVRPPMVRGARLATKIVRGPHIKSPPRNAALPDALEGEVVAKFGDKVSTGSISPDGVIVMGKRSNVADIAKHTFEKEMPSGQGDGRSEFYRIASEAKERRGSVVVAGSTYGQGSSREAAAMVMVELGVRAVLAKSFYRIHRTNLISQGVVPIVIPDVLYDAVIEDPVRGTPFAKPDQVITMPKIRAELEAGLPALTLMLGEQEFQLAHNLEDRERKILLAGGLINSLVLSP